jgi:hypothetical protein
MLAADPVRSRSLCIDLQSVASPDETPMEDDNGNKGEEVVDIKVSEILIFIMILLFVI